MEELYVVWKRVASKQKKSDQNRKPWRVAGDQRERRDISYPHPRSMIVGTDYLGPRE